MSAPSRFAPASVLALAACLALTSAIAAQEAAPAEVFFESMDLTVVNVEVFVTDKKGERVNNLTAEDFELYEDGRQVPISNFYAVENGRPVAIGDLETLAETTEPDLDLPLLDVPEAQRLYLVIYVDNLFIRPFNRNKVLRQAQGFLHRAVQRGDRVMVASFNRSLHVRQPFTEDLTEVEATLLELEEMTGLGVQAGTERRDVLRRIDQAETAFDAEGHALGYADSIYFDLRQSVDALRETVDALAGLPGRKALLYVSDGLPMTAGEELFYLIDQRFGGGRTSGQLQAARYRARGMIRELTAHANANRVTFYTVEAEGLRSHGSLSAEHGGSIDGGSLIELDSVRQSNVEATLIMMARDTGGLAATNTNNIAGALARVAEDFRTYYSLGYVPVNAEEGRYHRIEVKVKRRGLEVRHRDGYRGKSAEARVAEGVRAALRYGGGGNPLGVRLEIEGAQREPRGGDFRVPVLVKIPIGKLALLPSGDLHRGSVRVSMAAIDVDGDVSEVSQEPLRIDIPEADLEIARAAHYTYAAELVMRPGEHRIAVGVHDNHGGETSFVTEPVRIGG